MSLPPPRLELVRVGLYELVEPYRYGWYHNGILNRITVPAGFQCDLGSVPRILWPLIGPQDLGLPAVVIHDWGYYWSGALPIGSHERQVDTGWAPVRAPWPRREWEHLFGRIMRDDGVPRWRRRAAFRAVYLFGGWRWESNARRRLYG